MSKGAPTKAALLTTVAAGVVFIALTLCAQRTRTIEGTWIDLFEGSRFFEGQDVVAACRPGFWDASWFAFYPKPQTAEGKLIKANRNSGVFVSKYGPYPVAAYSVKFVGHHQILGMGFGHLGVSPSEYEVDRMLSIKPIASPTCDIRPE